ncbi:PAS domain-containing protein [Candidatus Xianfuyuplasma coldseepsis]|uniref:PAS domain-containing protein n=1 Tax=Candidatus Xianfuyuplasma coldseepsis TaxID=2782163 RepID=A0A7L7KS57_9MOLU|nr:PAS domain-containing protein [Xianfuyuplasma coldseepsis]QMS85092.1 PAS domain-containing protein [Xianfuyuplasma coldseepsis]
MNPFRTEELLESYNGIALMLEDDKIVYINHQFSELLGYTQNDVIDLHVIELINPDDRAEFTNGVFVNPGASEMTTQIYHKNGSHMYFTLNAFQFKNTYVVLGKRLRRQYKSFDYDITKEDIMQSYINHQMDVDDISEIVTTRFDELRFALDNLPVDFWIKDKDHRYLFMNEIMLKRTKMEPNSYYLKNDFDLFDRDIANDFLKTDMQAIKTKKKVQYIFESKTSRFVKWTEVSKVPIFNKDDKYIGLISCAIDISSIKGNEAELAQENKALLDILHSQYDVVVYINSDGYIEHQFNRLNLDFEQRHYRECFKENTMLLRYLDAGLKGIESNFLGTIKGIAANIVVKPVSLPDGHQRLFLFGREQRS